MNTRLLLRQLAKRFPKRYAKMNHDYVGLMTGKLPAEVHKIILCLDFDWEVLPLIKENVPDLIITHHPFIYGTKYQVFKFDKRKEELCNEIDALGVPVYSMHTNFDTGKDGMNDALAEALELTNIYAPEKEIMMRIGELKEAMPVEEFAKFAKAKLNVDYGLLIDEGKPVVKKVGIIGGGGSRDWPVARDEGCDIYISGDVSHHIRRDIVNEKFNYLDLPHEIERIFIPQMKKILLSIDPTLEILMVDHEELPKVI
ncbi:MAG: Nif3-like dinuclear metal center hexameric protein [Bacilli bacterium]|nr:Nif3-like dinuclear metal center hexameric protein [Bacilli bacterium]